MLLEGKPANEPRSNRVVQQVVRPPDSAYSGRGNFTGSPRFADS